MSLLIRKLERIRPFFCENHVQLFVCFKGVKCGVFRISQDAEVDLSEDTTRSFLGGDVKIYSVSNRQNLRLL